MILLLRVDVKDKGLSLFLVSPSSECMFVNFPKMYPSKKATIRWHQNRDIEIPSFFLSASSSNILAFSICIETNSFYEKGVHFLVFIVKGIWNN